MTLEDLNKKLIMRIVQMTSVHKCCDPRIYQRECKSLALAGFETIYIVPNDHAGILSDVQIKAVSLPKGRISRIIKTMWRVYRAAVGADADIYHFHDPELIIVGLILEAQGKRVVYDIHEDVPQDILSKHYIPHWLRKPLAKFIEYLENFACQRFSAIVAATPAIAERFIGLNKNTVIIQNFPRIADFTPPLYVDWAHRDCSVAYVGGIAKNRGICQMVAAMGFLPDNLPAKLNLAGTFSPTNLRDELSNFAGWARVEELGFLNYYNVTKLLGSVKAGLVVIAPEPQFLVSYPIKLFEYMASGIPVIASNFPLWRRIIRAAGCGILVHPNNARALAKAIEYILTHPVEAEDMGRRGREAVEKFYNWGIEKRKLLNLYKSMLGEICLG